MHECGLTVYSSYELKKPQPPPSIGVLKFKKEKLVLEVETMSLMELGSPDEPMPAS